MNILFHTVTAVGISALLTNTDTVHAKSKLKDTMPVLFLSFIVGIISHGILDYMPHTYPIDPKMDIPLALFSIMLLMVLVKFPYKLIVAGSLFGCILPDVIDLGPKMLNFYLGFKLPIPHQLFPWHLTTFSGSLFANGYLISTINHLMVLSALIVIVWARQKHLKRFFVNEV